MIAPTSLTPRRLRLFKAIALAMPLLLLAVLEGLLRLAGYGQDYRLFVTDDKHPDYWVMSRDASARYFTEGANATVGNADASAKRKTPTPSAYSCWANPPPSGFPTCTTALFTAGSSTGCCTRSRKKTLRSSTCR